jgi:hypothetical protein
VKLNTRSAKDAAIWQFRERRVEQLLTEGLRQLDRQGRRTPITECLLYVKTVNAVMRLCSGREVLSMFAHSYRVHDDLTAAMRFGTDKRHFDMKIVLRK